MKVTRALLDQLIGISICVIEKDSQKILYANQQLLLNAPYAIPGKLNPFDTGTRSLYIAFEQYEKAILLLPDFHEQMEQIENLLTFAEMENEEGVQALYELTDEIRNRLTKVAGLAYLAQSKSATAEKITVYTNTMHEDISFLQNMLGEVIDVIKIKNGKSCLQMQEFSLTNMFQEQCKQLGELFHTEHASVSFSVWKVKHDCVISDEERLGKIFRGVMMYYLEYTPRDGNIAVSIEEAEENNHYSGYVLTIDDGATGIADNYMESVLSPFCHNFKREADENCAIGIGLLLSRTLITLLSGTVAIQTSKGKGTKVSVTIPMLTKESEQPIQEDFDQFFPDKTEDNLCGKKMLLVEDNEINAGIAQMILESTEAVIDWVVDGVEAIQRLEESRENEYYAVLMDINMPRMDGYEATAKIRTSKRTDLRNILVIAMTAEDTEDEKDVYSQKGMDSYVEKPFEISDFLKALEEGKRRMHGRIS